MSLTTGRQLLAARRILGWTRADVVGRLDGKPGSHPNTLKYWEGALVIPDRAPAAVGNYRRTLEAAGIRFVSNPPGVAVEKASTSLGSFTGRLAIGHGMEECAA